MCVLDRAHSTVPKSFIKTITRRQLTTFFLIRFQVYKTNAIIVITIYIPGQLASSYFQHLHGHRLITKLQIWFDRPRATGKVRVLLKVNWQSPVDHHTPRNHHDPRATRELLVLFPAPIHGHRLVTKLPSLLLVPNIVYNRTPRVADETF